MVLHKFLRSGWVVFQDKIVPVDVYEVAWGEGQSCKEIIQRGHNYCSSTLRFAGYTLYAAESEAKMELVRRLQHLIENDKKSIKRLEKQIAELEERHG